MRVRKLLVGLLVAIFLAIPLAILNAQGRATPFNLRVNVDTVGNLLVAGGTLTGAATMCTFINCRLATDASGNLLVAAGSGSGLAPADATYITQTANANLSAEQALSSLSSGLMQVTTGTGVVSSTLTPAVNSIGFNSSFGTMDATADGVFRLLNNAGTGFARLTFGPATSSFGAIKANGSQLDAVLADNSTFTRVRGSFTIATDLVMNVGTNQLVMNTTAPSNPVSCGTSPAVTTANGTVSWVVTGGTGGTATGCSVTMPAASNGWNCHITNITQTAAHRADRDTRQTASTTTSVTWEYVVVSTGAVTAFTASDVFRGMCIAY